MFARGHAFITGFDTGFVLLVWHNLFFRFRFVCFCFHERHGRKFIAPGGFGFRRRPCSIHFQYAVHRAERIRAAIGIVSGFVGRARFAAPLPIHHEFVFVATRRERHRAGPLVVGLVAMQWRGFWLPIVKGAGDEHRLRLRCVAGQVNSVNVTVRL